MSDAVSTILASLNQVLRFIAPGFVGLGLVLLLCKDPGGRLGAVLAEQGAVLFIAAVLLGMLLNSIHVAVFEDLFGLVVLSIVRCLSGLLHYEIPGGSLLASSRELEARRLRRRGKDGPAARFQQEHDRYASTLTFLYCSSYPSFIFAILQILAGHRLSCWPLAFGVILFGFALACDWRYTTLDAWAAKEFSASPSGEQPAPAASKAT